MSSINDCSADVKNGRPALALVLLVVNIDKDTNDIPMFLKILLLFKDDGNDIFNENDNIIIDNTIINISNNTCYYITTIIPNNYYYRPA
jgi:hypothetical protein